MPVSGASSNDNGGCHPVSETRNSQTVSLVQEIVFQTSVDSSFKVGPSIAIQGTRFPIASGGLGDVYKCILNRGASQEEVAVKSPRFPSLTDAEVAKINHNLDRELRLWAVLEHQYVLRVYGTVNGFGPFRAVVTPWMPNGTINSYLNRANLTAMNKLSLFKQIVEGLKYLHDNDVIHGDLTSNNILVSADGSPRITDFGISNIMVESNPAFSYQTGAVRWAAPELIVLQEGCTVQCATKSSDIYALGCIMLQVLYGKLPYWWIKTALQVMASKFNYQEPINDTLEIQAHHLTCMRRCWLISAESRPSVEETLTFIDGMFPHVLDWPSFYNLRELPNQTITTYEHRGTVAGGLGDVWKCSWCNNSQETEVAVRSVRVRHTGNTDEVEQMIEMITQEAAAWAESSCHNILPLYCTIPYFRPLPAFMFPWMANGTLTDYLQREFSRLSETRKFDILNQVVAALKHLHDDDIAHGSLTSDDVFLDGSGRVYLAHFGRLSKVLARGQILMSGSAKTFELRYIAPELLAPIVDGGAPRSTKAGDIYSFGCLMIQVLLGKIPYWWIGDAGEVLPERVKGVQPFRMKQTNEMLLTFGQQCLSVESKARPSIEDVFCFALVQSIGAADLTDSIIRINQYAANSGGYADVHRCRLVFDSTTALVQQAVSHYQVPLECVDVAVKVFRPMGGIEMPRLINRFSREIKISSTLNHENIVPLWGVARQFGVLPALVSPWLRNGTLTEYLRNKHKELSCGQQFALLRDVARGLQYLHSQLIVHGDLSGFNVLIDGDGKARLTDFGLSALIPARISQVLLPTAPGGTLHWIAPEYLRADASDVPSMVSQASDVYSFGGIMLQVLEGKIPYHYIAHTAAIVGQISQGVTPRRPVAPVIIDDDWDFIQQCWSSHAASRPSATEIVTIMEARAG
ncbi:kinase-like domain-containing protein [Suillus lakei]|nr:kinase-like domain-containing protein [Suillus lakei]